MHVGGECPAHEEAKKFFTFRCSCPDPDDDAGRPRASCPGRGSGGRGRGDPNSASARKTAKSRERKLLQVAYIDSEALRQNVRLRKKVAELLDGHEATAALKRMKEEFESLRELLFAMVKSPDGRPVYLMDKVDQGRKKVTVRWGGGWCRAIKVGHRFLASGDVEKGRKKRRIITVTRVSGPHTLLQIYSSPYLRAQVLTGEDLPDSDESWQLLVSWLAGWRKNAAVHGLADFYVWWFDIE